MWFLDLWLLFLSAVLVILIVRAFWLSDQLGFPMDWNVAEKRLGRVVAFAFAAAAISSITVAAYVASVVPWVENFPALLSHPPQIVAGRQPAHISTAAYLFLIPVGLGVAAGLLTDPWGRKRLHFRGSRDLSLRALPVVAIVLGVYSIYRSIDALSAAQ